MNFRTSHFTEPPSISRELFLFLCCVYIIPPSRLFFNGNPHRKQARKVMNPANRNRLAIVVELGRWVACKLSFFVCCTRPHFCAAFFFASSLRFFVRRSSMNCVPRRKLLIHTFYTPESSNPPVTLQLFPQ